MRRILLILATVAIIATACSGDDPFDAGGDNPDNTGDDTVQRNDDGDVVIQVDGNEIVLTSGLSGFADCDSLLDHVRAEAAERVGPYGFNDGGWYGPVAFEGGRLFDGDDVAVDVAESAAFDSGDDAGGDADSSAQFQEVSGELEGVDFSGTNVQEIGVDEADVIKTDGERIFVVANGELVVVDVDARRVVGSVAVNAGWNAELFLAGDDVLLVTNTWFDEQTVGVGYPSVGGTDDAEAEFADDIAIEPYYYESSGTLITRISVAGDDPRIIEKMAIEGDYVSSRGVDGVARIIVRSNPQYRFPFVYPAGPAGEDRATESNRATVLDSELSDWLPGFTLFDDDGDVTDQGLLPDCGQVHAPTEFSGFGVLSVLNIPINGDIDPGETSSVLAPGNIVYASTDSLYVATQTWVDARVFDDADDWQTAWDQRQTSIHRFGLSESGAAYTASGSVPGDIRDQFSLSEYDGHLRVITTTGEQWDETSETHVRVLRETDGSLVEVGSVGDMGNGEAVQSVRFVGDVGYVVTFRQVDPFYTLDLSDPENPRVVGELKIPGFSSYLHPIGEGMVLGVGSDGTEEGRITGSKVSVFDVSDLSNPQEIAIWTAPDGWNDVGWDHRSFLWWAPEQLAVVPVTVYDQNGHWAGAVVLKVADGEIREVGRIDHAETGQVRGSTECDRVTIDDLGGADNPEEFETELQWMLTEDSGSLVLLCDPGEDRVAAGYECYADEWLLDEAERAGLDVPRDTTLVYCWDNYQSTPTISRTMVVNADELWSLSSQWGGYSGEGPGRLQVNDLFDLDRLGAISVG